MAKLNINLAGLPKPVKIIIMLLPGLLYAVIFSFLVLVPKTKQVQAYRGEVATQENEIAKTQSMTAKLEILKEENENLRKRLVELSEQLPEEKEVSLLLTQVSDKSTDAGLQILSWKPATRALHSSNIVYQVPVSVALKGSYHRLGTFLSSLTKLKRIVNITDIKMGSPSFKDTEATLSITFTAVTFTAAEAGGLSK